MTIRKRNAGLREIQFSQFAKQLFFSNLGRNIKINITCREEVIMSTKSQKSRKLPGLNNIYGEDLNADPTLSVKDGKNSTGVMMFMSPYPQQRQHADQCVKKSGQDPKNQMSA
jgi:hypothetical protein